MICNIKNQRGMALLMVLFTVLFLGTIAGILVSKSFDEHRLAVRNALTTETFYLAEGGIQNALYQFSEAVANFQPPPSQVITVYSAVDSGLESAVVVTDITAQGEEFRITNSDGTITHVQNYQFTASANHPDYPDVSTTLNQIVARRKTCIYSYSVFYNHELELLVGPPMNFKGRLYCNGDIYLACHNSLAMDTEFLWCTGELYHRRKDRPDMDMPGTVTIKRRGSDPAEFVDIPDDFVSSEYDEWINDSLELWNGTVQTGAHGIKEVAVPSLGSIEPGGYYNEIAGLVIVDNVVYDGSGNRIFWEEGQNPVSEQTIYDYREGTWVTLTTIDIEKLNESSHFPSNGLIYATRNDVSSDEPNGIRVVNGSELQNDMTIVTNTPLYIQGDYNNINKKHSSVICDALNIFSNNWSDANSDKGMGARKAMPTEVNTGMITGNVPTPTEPGPYSGGLENLPRFHEDWHGVKFTMHGAWICLWESEIATGRWGDASYDPPDRDWYYEEDFVLPNNWPPEAPQIVEIERTAWWK